MIVSKLVLKSFQISFLAFLAFSSATSFAQYPPRVRRNPPPMPDCYDSLSVPGESRFLPVDNQQVLLWKTTTPNQTLRRAHIAGRINRLFPGKNSHDHFELRIGPNPEDVIEVIYNFVFGALPELHVGDAVDTCGDYITSTAAAGHYPPSPSGAIIHWIHRNPKRPPFKQGGRNAIRDENPGSHDHGFLIIQGQLYGWHLPPKQFRGYGLRTASPWQNTQNSSRQQSR